MKFRTPIALMSVSMLLLGCVPPQQVSSDPPATGPDTQGGVSTGSGPHVESGGRVVVEAEHYTAVAGDYFELLGAQIPLDNVAWFTQRDAAQTGSQPDPDGYHEGASGNAYVELLPDLRVTHADPMPAGSFYDDLGGATLQYQIQFVTAGTYYVWVRNFSSGTEDNGIHVSVNGALEGDGRKLQSCGTGSWKWSSNQRDSGGTACGVPRTVKIHIPSAGLHTIVFHQREDGFEFDRFLLTTDANYTPGGAGPVESPRLNP